MPSSGLPMEEIFRTEGRHTRKECQEQIKFAEDAAKIAMAHGLFAEWLECFVGAWNKTKDVNASIRAGLIEWDM